MVLVSYLLVSCNLMVLSYTLRSNTYTCYCFMLKSKLFQFKFADFVLKFKLFQTTSLTHCGGVDCTISCLCAPTHFSGIRMPLPMLISESSSLSQILHHSVWIFKFTGSKPCLFVNHPMFVGEIPLKHWNHHVGTGPHFAFVDWWTTDKLH